MCSIVHWDKFLNGLEMPKKAKAVKNSRAVKEGTKIIGVYEFICGKLT